MTNAEYIRKMDDGELAGFILNFDNGEIDYSKRSCDACYENDCDKCIKWWLGLDTKEPQGLEYEEKKGSHEWISTKDRLPKDDGFYLVWHQTHGTSIERYYKTRKWATAISEGITHWMPLPEPPEDKECKWCRVNYPLMWTELPEPPEGKWPGKEDKQ